MIPLLIVLSAVAPVLGVPPLCRRLAAGIARLLALLVTNFTEARKKLSERARLRVAAALLDLGGQLARLPLALAWLTVRSVVVWRQAPARP